MKPSDLGSTAAPARQDTARARVVWRALLRCFRAAPERQRIGCIGAVVAILLGWILGPFAGPGSYDALILLPQPALTNDVFLIRMDEAAHRELGQQWGQPWNRALHAQLVRQLTRDRASLIVCDIWFRDGSNTVADQEFTRSLRESGRVVLAAERVTPAQSEALWRQTVLPWSNFVSVCAGWGLTDLTPDRDATVRMLDTGDENNPTLPWTAAHLAGATRPVVPGPHGWVRHYGPYGTLPSLSYHLALAKPAEFFRNKFVFIGGKPRTRFVGEEVDEFRTPFTRRDGQFSSGLDIMATMFLNLVRGDWLQALPAWLDLLLLTVIGAAAGFGLGALRPLRALGAGLFAALLVGAGAAALLMWCNTWFSWTVPLYAQIPVAAAWSIFASLTGVCRARPLVPEHELIRCIGQGAYGEVWLARNVIGIFRAVKLVRRGDFPSTEPYEREFRGMQKYMPISLHHPALLPVLQVGRDDESGHFYYVMELGDDVTGRAECDPARYTAKTLSGELQARKCLPAVECARLGAALADALDHLHRQQLIHRDVKPGNIVFVRGQPKLADIGLVADVDPERGPVSYLGTEGFMAPEGPGVAGDIYALGKVLYQALTGFDVRQNLVLPAGFENWPDAPAVLALNEVICRACDPIPADRYRDAGQMRDELRRIT